MLLLRSPVLAWYWRTKPTNNSVSLFAVMAKATPIKEALARFEKESGVSVAQAEKVIPILEMLPYLKYYTELFIVHLQVELTAQVPSIEKMDASLGVLKACR